MLEASRFNRRPWRSVIGLALIVCALAACGSTPGVHGDPPSRPPAAATTAVLEGGLYGGIQVEIGAGQRTITERPLATLGTSRLSVAHYVYAGRLDRFGRAVFRPK